MKRLAAYIAAFLLCVVVLYFLPGWRTLDWQIFAALQRGETTPWSAEIEVIDVPYLRPDGRFSLVEYRVRLQQLMEHLAAAQQGKPKAVIFDIAFGEETEGAAALLAGLRTLGREGIRRYGAIDVDGEDGTKALPSSPRQLMDGVGHTRFERRGSVLLYAPQLRSDEGMVIEALAVRAAADLYATKERFAAPRVAVRLGAPSVLHDHLWHWREAGDPAGRLIPDAPHKDASLDGRIVIVGSLEKDADRFDGRTGPELLGWALSGRIARADSITGPQPLDAPALALALLVLVPALSASAFLAARKRIHLAARTPLAALVAATGAALVLAAVVAVLVALGRLYAQVTLVMLASLAAIAFAWLHAFQREALASLHADLEGGKLQAAESYDVFISYSREPRNAQWVEAQVYKPLSLAHHPDGRPLKVFFDTRSLRLGDFWYRRLALAIAGSRHFVAVYSDDYFDKSFCLHEMTLALARSAQKADFILPLLRTSKPIPAGYEHIQYIDARQPGFIDEIVARCTAQ